MYCVYILHLYTFYKKTSKSVCVCVCVCAETEREGEINILLRLLVLITVKLLKKLNYFVQKFQFIVVFTYIQFSKSNSLNFFIKFNVTKIISDLILKTF